MKYKTARTTRDVEALAAAKGLRVRYPQPNELFIDIDSAEAYAQFKRLREVFERGEPIVGTTIAASPSEAPGHYHAIVTLRRDVLPRERVMLQALLGSDPMRELLSYRRVIAGSDPEAVSVFFERPVLK